jgi:hypothetical protein
MVVQYSDLDRPWHGLEPHPSPLLGKEREQFLVIPQILNHSTPTIITPTRPPSPFQGEGRGEVPIHATTNHLPQPSKVFK